MSRRTRTIGLALLGAAAIGILAAVVVRDQLHRHRRDLFSPNSFRRLAALGHMTGELASVDAVTMLKDFMAWEPRRMLRVRAGAVLERMEQDLMAMTAEETLLQ